MPTDPPNPCSPIPKVYPPNATNEQKQCIDVAYDAYLLGLTNCHGDQTCCQQVRINYDNAVAQCVGEQ
jgi:hypothetical protein